MSGIGLQDRIGLLGKQVFSELTQRSAHTRVLGTSRIPRVCHGWTITSVVSRLKSLWTGYRRSELSATKSGTPRTVFVPNGLRYSYLCGDTNASSGFVSLAEAASRSLTGVDLAECPFRDEVSELFRKPRGGIRQVFGEVIDPPRKFIAKTWQSELLLYPAGVIIDTPLSEQAPSSAHWLLLLHKLAWFRLSGSPLHAQRICWHGNLTVPYDLVVSGKANVNVPPMFRENLVQMSTTSYYSIIGTRSTPWM